MKKKYESMLGFIFWVVVVVTGYGV